MKASLPHLSFAMLVAAAAPAGAQDVGRVLLATGDAVVVREGQNVPPTFGMPVREKDVLRTGAGASLQVRFIDESVTSLRENSELRIDEFRFPGKEDGTERAVFRLLKGGLRTITGLVGRTNNRAYSMSSVVSTIGIRGTDFATTLCQQDCRNPDGSLARDGQYGRVLGQSSGTNRIDVSGEAGQQRTLGISENFFQADAKSPIELLLTPPAFVGSQSPATRTAKAPAGTGKEQPAGGGASQDSRSTAPSTAPTILSFAAPLAGDSVNPPVATVATPPGESTIAGPATIAGLGAFTEVNFEGQPANGGGFFAVSQLTTDPAGAAANLALSQKLLKFTLPAGSQAGGGSTTTTGDSGGSALVLDETQLNALNAHWGRWTGTTIVTDAGTTTSPPGGFHYLYGPLTPAEVVASKRGTVMFVDTGFGTTPRNSLNEPGTISVLASDVNFTTRIVMLGGVNMSFPSYSFNFPGGSTASIQIVPGKGAFIEQVSSGACLGGPCGMSTSAVLGRTGIFMGPNGDHMGMALQARTTPNGNTASAQATRILHIPPPPP